MRASPCAAASEWLKKAGSGVWMMVHALDDPRAVPQPAQRVAHSIVGLALVCPVELCVGVSLHADARKLSVLPIGMSDKLACKRMGECTL